MSKRVTRIPKIAYIITPITYGGAERVNLNFLVNVDRCRFKVDPILFLRPWEDEAFFETELKRLGIGYIPVPVAKTDKIDLFRVFHCYSRLKKVIDANNYDLIHTHGYLADFFGYLVSKKTNIPIMSTCHGFIDEGIKLTLYNRLDRQILKYFDRIIAVSDLIKSTLVTQGIFPDNISVVINATPTKAGAKDVQKNRSALRSELKMKQEEIIIGYVGRLSKEKGIKYLFEAIAMLVKEFVPVKLLIVGDGPQKSELYQLTISLNIEGKVILTGFQPNVDEWIAVMDFFVLPSITEGTPMALLEVMSQGVPCIASAVGGIPQVIDSGVDGILVAPGKPDEICDAILKLSRDHVKRNYISKNAKEKVLLKYNVKEWTKKIEKEYLDAIGCINPTLDED